MKFKIATVSLLPLAVIVMISSAKINPSNPPTGRTGAPGETTCQASGCHSGGSFTGTVEITGVPDTVVAGQSYTLTLTNTSNAIKSGFQLTVLDENNTKAGTLTAGTGCSIGNAGGRQYVRQSSPHTLMNGSTSWSFTWKAPASVQNDSIHFYFASLFANNNGQNSGDNAINSSKSVVLPAFVSATGAASNELQAKIYPNPTCDYLNVEIPGTGKVSLMGATGKTVLEATVKNSQKLDISHLPSGLYFLKIESQGKLWSTVFVKNG